MEAARDLVKHARALVEHARAMDALWQKTNPVYSMLAGPDGEWEDALVEALGDVMVYAENRAAQQCRLAHAVDTLDEAAMVELERRLVVGSDVQHLAEPLRWLQEHAPDRFAEVFEMVIEARDELRERDAEEAAR